MAGIHELFYDPSRIAYDEGRWIAPIGGHSDHVHVSFADPQAALTIIAYARSLGLNVTENPYVGSVDRTVHTGTSYHYRDFPGTYNGRKLGMAIDVNGSPAGMARFAEWVKRTYATGPAPSVTAQAAAQANDPAAGNVSSSSAAGAGCLTVIAVQVAVVSSIIGGTLWWIT